MSEKPKISLISINWNGGKRLNKFCDGLRALEYPKDRLEIVIHDNASSDNSLEILRPKLRTMLAEGWARAELIEAAEHPGPNRAYITAYENTSLDSEYIIAIDNDVELEAGAIRHFIETIRQDERNAVVGCKVLFANRPEVANCGAVFFRRYSIHSKICYPDVPTACDEILDCVFFVRRRAIDSVGYFHDERLIFFCMGKELFTRLKGAGWQIIYDPRAIAYHDAGYTTNRHRRLTLYLNVRDSIVYHTLHSSRGRRVHFLLRMIVSGFKHLIVRRSWVYFEAIKDGIVAEVVPLGWWSSKNRDRKPGGRWEN